MTGYSTADRIHFEFDDLPLWDHLRMHLLEGKHRAVTQRRLAEATGTSIRAVQEAIEGAKRSGVPIVTGSVGVWLSSDVAELRDFYERNRRRISTQWLNNRGILKAIAALEKYEQTRFWSDAA